MFHLQQRLIYYTCLPHFSGLRESSEDGDHWPVPGAYILLVMAGISLHARTERVWTNDYPELWGEGFQQ